MMKVFLKQGLQRMPPPLPVLVEDAYRYVRYPRIRRERRMWRRILRKLHAPDRVAQGPFQGMRYISRAYGSMILPKLLGTYERELGASVEAICRAGCDRIVDIGAAEGYYAVGLALRNPEVPVICFELSPSARFYLRRLARRNDVLARITALGGCTTEALESALKDAVRPAVVCDCEGAEDELLDPDRVPSLRRSLILVETHDLILPGVERRLLERFSPSHEIEVIRYRERGPEDLPDGIELSREETAEATDEYRRRAEWLFMRPRSDVSAPSPARG